MLNPTRDRMVQSNIEIIGRSEEFKHFRAWLRVEYDRLSKECISAMDIDRTRKLQGAALAVSSLLETLEAAKGG